VKKSMAKTRLAELFGLDDLREIVISDKWSGLSPASPIMLHAQLVRHGEAFVGGSELRCAPESRPDVHFAGRVEVRAHAGVIASAMKALEHIYVTRGVYQALLLHTDDFPSIEIVARSGADELRLFTESQGEHHTPWGAHIRGGDYVIDEAGPMNALRSLRPQLGWERLERAIERAIRAGRY
jgi:hypothetical protein